MTSGEFQPQPGPYGEPGGYPPPSGGQEPGGLGLRFAARLIDGIIVNVVAFGIALAIGSLTNYWVTGLFSGLLMFVYFLAFESTQGWTPGKKLLGLSVHGPAGAPKPVALHSRCAVARSAEPFQIYSHVFAPEM